MGVMSLLLVMLSFSPHCVGGFSNTYLRLLRAICTETRGGRTTTTLVKAKPTTTTTLHLTTLPDPLPQFHLYNSLGNAKMPFKPIFPPHVKMYSCGPTVYDRAHIGNFRAFLTVDVLKRALVFFGYEVDHVCNLTDIDDKIIARCNESDETVKSLTEKFTKIFFDDLDKLNIIRARSYPRATEEIDSMVEMVEGLVKKGYGYKEASTGDYYFDVSKSNGYGSHLTNVDTSEILGDRGRDFALWKSAKEGFDREGESIWDVSLGRGRPGWHLECSAMCRKYLGDEIDIHCGGSDLKFPHHENEIAQTTAFTGKPRFCEYWVHNGFVTVGSEAEKMSKSLGNFMTLSEVDDVRAFRFGIVSSYYRGPLRFSEDVFRANKIALCRLDNIWNRLIALEETSATGRATVRKTDSNLSALVAAEVKKFCEALADDLATPRCTASLFSIVKAAENELKARDGLEGVDEKGLRDARDAIKLFDQVCFGVLPVAKQAGLDNGGGESDRIVPTEVLRLASERAEAKKVKDFKTADSIREKILGLGFTVKDGKCGTFEVEKT